MKIDVRVLGPVLACSLAFLAPACRSGGDPPAPATPVRVQTLARLGNETALRYSGSVTPETKVDVSFKAGGYISEIARTKGADGRMRLVQQGDRVDKGKLLARVDESEYADKVKVAEADLAKAKAIQEKDQEAFRRADNLYKTQSITAPEYDRAKKDLETSTANVAAAEAQLDGARLELGYCKLTAPMGGVVLQRNIEIGTLVHPGSVGFVMADVSTIKVVFGVPDVMLRQIEPGSKLDFTTASIPERTFTGTVTSVAPAADTSSRTFQIEITAPNADGALRDGMVASLKVDKRLQSAEAIGVPLSAIVRAPDDPDGFALFVVEESDGGARASLKTIEVGQVYGNNVAVVSGVAAEDKVIVTGAKMLTDGQPVKVIP